MDFVVNSQLGLISFFGKRSEAIEILNYMYQVQNAFNIISPTSSIKITRKETLASMRIGSKNAAEFTVQEGRESFFNRAINTILRARALQGTSDSKTKKQIDCVIEKRYAIAAKESAK